MLNELEAKTLFVLYQLKYNYDQLINFKELGFENKRQATLYLNKLRNQDYIDFNVNQVFNTVDPHHEVFQIWSGDIDLLEIGYNEVKKLL